MNPAGAGPAGPLRQAWLAVLTVLIAVGACLLIMELLLRLLPVATGLRIVPVDAAQPLFHATPERAFVHSRYAGLAEVNRGRSNNAGFINDQAYQRNDPRPLLAVIGDSYIEALMVPYDETLHGRLAAAHPEQLRVYSFAFSGAPLSQYLAWIDHARRHYAPTGYIVVVVGNDFDESHAAYKQGPGFHHYVEQPDGTLRLRLFEYRPSPLRDLLRRSALARYLVLNLAVVERLGALRDTPRATRDAATPAFVGNTAAGTDAERMQISLRVIDAFLRDLECVSGVPPGRVLFAVEGIREAIYAADGAGSEVLQASYLARMRNRFMAAARAQGHAVVDLHEAFATDHARHGERFESALDWHWNGRGHDVAATAVTASGFLTRLLDDGSDTARAAPTVATDRGCGLGIVQQH